MMGAHGLRVLAVGVSCSINSMGATVGIQPRARGRRGGDAGQ